MSLLNRPSDGMHSILVVIHNLLSQEGVLPFETIAQPSHGLADLSKKAAISSKSEGVTRAVR
jgi:hypothetical protein